MAKNLETNKVSQKTLAKTYLSDKHLLKINCKLTSTRSMSVDHG